ncbi:MAG TPA: hypothetical protein VH250_13955 [Granulicella sp.]|nr:hypothetical protein [Granulicella sp.]
MTHRLLRFLGFGFAVMAVGMSPAHGQMHKVAPPENVVRAVGVYEWTGDIAKPTASRLIPVSLFIDGHLEDAGVYMARPVPFALDNGTVYEVDQAGIAKGLIDLRFARHLESADLATVFDDGWFGYGSFKAPSAPKPLVATGSRRGGGGHRAEARASAPADDDPSRPHLIRKPGSEGDDANADAGKDASSGSGNQNQNQTTAANDDPDRPHLTRKQDSSGSGSTAGSAPASTDDSGQSSGEGGGKSSGAGSVPADDPDRPTLKKRTPEQAKQARRESEQSSVSGESTSLNDDPNRPTLHRGVPTHALTEVDLPKLKGVPENLHQMVAVSDAKTREPHDFARPWQDDAERATVLASMQALAEKLLASYGTKAAQTPAAKTTAAKTGTAAGKSATRSTVRKKATPATPAAVPLLDEELKGYTLSYGGADTFVYSAHTAGDGDKLRYVTVVAQKDAMGTLKPAIQSVTDAAHLDRTPRMRLVDVVDAEASNRASLLFELRGQTARQFALYRVIAARADQTFVTGTTQ